MRNADEQWNPGHRLNKGYPFEKIESKELFPSRVKVEFDKSIKKVSVDINPDIFPDVPVIGEQRTGFEDFLMFRLLETTNALEIAEGQIEDILTEDPFIPEHFGFEVVHENAEVTETPIRVYSSKHHEGVSLFRQPGDVSDPEWDPSEWTMLRKCDKDNNSSVVFLETKLNLPCSRIAYAAFYALGIKMKADEVELNQSDVTIEIAER